MTKLDNLQARQAVWANRNFPNKKQHQQLLGMIEELAEMRDATTMEELKDGIGDAVIFAFGYMNELDINASQCLEASKDTDFDPYLSTNELHALAHHHCGMMAKGQLKMEQGIRGNAADHLELICKHMGLFLLTLDVLVAHNFQGTSLHSVVSEIWTEVEKRDWVKYPKNGVSDDQN